MQKTFTVDCFSHQSKKNKGEKPRYLLRNGIPKIISRKDWMKTQELLKDPCKGKLKKIGTVEKPKFYVLKIKSGMFKNFIVLDTEWSQAELEKIILEGESNND